jgi:hypothetical protein
VKQLEQRVESLIGLIASKNTVPESIASAINTDLDYTESILPTAAQDPGPTAPTTGADLKIADDWAETHPYQAYDPVAEGVIDEQHAYRLVEEFKASFISSFPFVLVESDAKTLRQQQTFLFHAILAVSAYRTPNLQVFLGEELRRQLARVIECAHKSLEILQGLLVYGAWYVPDHLSYSLPEDVASSLHTTFTSINHCKIPGAPKSLNFFSVCANCIVPSLGTTHSMSLLLSNLRY